MTALIFLLVLSVVCWFIVLNSRARERFSKPVREFYRARKDYQDMFDASSFAAALVGALIFTIFFLFLLVLRIAG